MADHPDFATQIAGTSSFFGFVGTVLSSTVTGWGRFWGGTIDDLKTDGYLLQNATGATMLTIPVACARGAGRWSASTMTGSSEAGRRDRRRAPHAIRTIAAGPT
jgi:hypothetical protein